MHKFYYGIDEYKKHTFVVMYFVKMDFLELILREILGFNENKYKYGIKGNSYSKWELTLILFILFSSVLVNWTIAFKTMGPTTPFFTPNYRLNDT